MSNRTTGGIFSCGYQLRNLANFLQHIIDAQITVVLDVRETPWSHRPGFSSKPLREALSAVGIEYEHARYAGNPKSLRLQADSHQHCLELYAEYLEQTPTITDRLAEWLTPRLAEGKNVCLLCYERHPADCHRSILLYRWQELTDNTAEITHLDPHGAPRFTSQDLAAVRALACA